MALLPHQLKGTKFYDPKAMEAHEKAKEKAEIKRRMIEDGFEEPVKRRITVPTKGVQHALIPGRSWKKYRKDNREERTLAGATGEIVPDEKLLKDFHKDNKLYEGEKARKAPLVFGPSTGDIKMGILGTEDYELDQFVVPYTGFKGFGGGYQMGEVLLPETDPEEFEKLKFSYEDYERARTNALSQENLEDGKYFDEATDQEKIDDLARNYLERDLAMRAWREDLSENVEPAEQEKALKELKEYFLLWDKAQGLEHHYEELDE